MADIEWSVANRHSAGANPFSMSGFLKSIRRLRNECDYIIALMHLGKEHYRWGNRSPYAAPHGVFPCSGDDRWVAITVFNQEEWEAFCNVLGDPPWTREERFATLSARKENEEELESLVAEWTKGYSPHEIMKRLQAVGVAAGAVQNAQDLLEHDPQLKEREFLVPLEHPVLGSFGHPTPPYKLLKNKAQVRTSPCLGEHTYFVCTQFLGMPDEDFLELEQAGVFV